MLKGFDRDIWFVLLSRDIVGDVHLVPNLVHYFVLAIVEFYWWDKPDFEKELVFDRFTT